MRRTSISIVACLMWIAAIGSIAAETACGQNQRIGGDMFGSPDWQRPTLREATNRLLEAISDSPGRDGAADRIARQMERAWSGEGGRSRLDQLISILSQFWPELEEAVQRVAALDPVAELPEIERQLATFQSVPLVQAHFRLYVGYRLRQSLQFGAAMEILTPLQPADVLVPERLLFEQIVIYHQLMDVENCQQQARRLLQRESELPRRFTVLAQAALRDMQALEAGGLDEIARLMDDVGRRLALQRTGPPVLEREQQIVDKLDQLIKQLEQKQALAAGQASGGSPSQPMDDSQGTGTMGDGQVIDKEIVDGGAWGDVPPAKRAAALAEMAKDLPPHYRTAIEEFFRRLAGDDRQ